MNRAGHRHQQWHARTEQQQQVAVSAPGGLRDGASSTSEGRAAELSPGSSSTVSTTPGSILDSFAGSAASLLASACPHHDDQAFSPVVRHAHRARTGDVSGAVHPVEQAYLHRMVQAVAAYLCEISISEYPKISSSSGRLAESCTEWRQEKTRPPRGDQRSG